MEHLSALDAAFLQIEDADPRASLAIGSVTVIDGPAPTQGQLVAAFGARLREVPRFGQKVRMAPLDLTQPAWVDDPEFDLGYHLRRTALPAPGDEAALLCLVSRVMSQRLNRDRPLWECWVVEGLAGGRWAVLMNVHHCIADGVSGSSLYDLLSDTPARPTDGQPARRAAPTQRPVARPWPLEVVDTLATAATAPVRLIRSGAGMLGGAGRLVADLLAPVKPSTLGGPIGRTRRFGVARASLVDVREIGAAFGVTINDVALAVITAAFRALLVSRGQRPWAESVRTLVPTPTRADGDRQLDNRVSAMLAFLPVDLTDPVQRLAEVHVRMGSLKSSHESEAGASTVSLTRYLPVAWLVRFIARYPQRSIVTVTTNVPGPQRPLSVLGRRIVEIWPIVPIAVRMRTGIAIISYRDQLTFGITSDYRTAPEIDLLAAEIERGITELLEAAGTRSSRPRIARRPVTPAARRPARSTRSS